MSKNSTDNDRGLGKAVTEGIEIKMDALLRLIWLQGAEAQFCSQVAGFTERTFVKVFMKDSRGSTAA